MFCSKCGIEIIEGQLFCSKCGQAINAPNAQPASPDVDNLMTLAEREVEAEDWDKALEYTEKALQIKPNDSTILEKYESVLVGKGKFLFNEGLKIGDQIETMRKTNCSTLGILSSTPLQSDINIKNLNDKVSECNKKYDEAAKCYDKVLSVNKKNVDAIYGKAEILMLYRGPGGPERKEKTLELCKKVLKLNPKHKPTLKLLETHFKCPKCKGNGRVAGMWGPKPCPQCGGTGKGGDW